MPQFSESLMSCIWMSHGLVITLCLVFAWAMSFSQIRRVTCKNTSCHMHKYVVSRAQIRCITHNYLVSRAQIRHVTCTNTSYHAQIRRIMCVWLIHRLHRVRLSFDWFTAYHMCVCRLIDSPPIKTPQPALLTMQCVAVCCSVLQCVAVCCSALYCSVLQCVAVCCSVLQYVAVCCSALYCSVLQCVAVCCSMLQCSAVWSIQRPVDLSSMHTGFF